MLHNKRSYGVLGITVVLLLSITIMVYGQETGLTPDLAATATPDATTVPTTMPASTPIPTSTPTMLPTATEVQSISVTNISPTQFVAGTGGTVSISGSNFTNNTSVSLNGTTSLTITGQTDTQLTAVLGSDVAAGTYSIVVQDTYVGTQMAAGTITVLAAPTVMPTETPTIVPSPTTTVSLSVYDTEPSQVTTGTNATLSIIGAGFTEATTVRLIGYGFLSTSYLNASSLTAIVPETVPAGAYTIEVSDTSTGTTIALETLNVVTVPTSTPIVTTTPVPGQPELIVSAFSAMPAAIYPGETTTFTLQISNVGTRTASGIVLSSGSMDFSPANGQSGVTVPDLASGASYTVQYTISAPASATEGVQNITLALSSYDSTGQTYNDEATVSVTILEEVTGEAQIVLDSYRVEPATAVPGEMVTVQALFMNTGTETAEQVLVQLDGTNSPLIAGSAGNSYAIGTIPAGSVEPVVMQFTVAADAEAGAQSQSLAISYIQDGEAKQSTASISLTIEEVTTSAPLLLLQSYNTGETDLQPGDQFTFEMTLQNAGVIDVSNLMVTFGTIDTSNSGSSDSTQSETNTTTTSSNDFVIYGSGDTLPVGGLAAGETFILTQDFIVSSDLGSGIHSLPVTLQYEDADGNETQKSLTANVIVIVPPQLRLIASDVDDLLTVDEEYDLTLEIINLGDDEVYLTDMTVAGDNVEVTEGAEILLEPLQGDDDTTESISFIPQEEGAYSVTLTVSYVNDLNRAETITETVTGDVEAAAQTIRQPPQNRTQQQTIQEDESISIGRLLLGFLGFGG